MTFWLLADFFLFCLSLFCSRFSFFAFCIWPWTSDFFVASLHLKYTCLTFDVRFLHTLASLCLFTNAQMIFVIWTCYFLLLSVNRTTSNPNLREVALYWSYNGVCFLSTSSWMSIVYPNLAVYKTLRITPVTLWSEGASGEAINLIRSLSRLMLRRPLTEGLWPTTTHFILRE